MRPIVRGDCPQNGQGNDIQFNQYKNARGELLSRLGEYCSYCEMELDTSLAVEHIRPKKPPGAAIEIAARVSDWHNFLLACTNCNSTKSNKEVVLDEYLWPDRDNTYLAIKYSEGGLVDPADYLPPALETKAEETIKLTGLDKKPGANAAASDRRWNNRREAWDKAVRAKSRLARNNTQDFKDQILDTAVDKGYWSIWMTVFSDDADMLQRLITSFSGTCGQCFDANNNYEPIARTGGQC